MSNLKDFDAMLAEKVGGRPEFILGGQKFTCRAKLPWKKYSALILKLTSGEYRSAEEEMVVTEKFFRMVLLPADRDRFFELLNRGSDDEDDEDEDVIANPQVGYLIDWLLRKYNGVPEPEEKKADVAESTEEKPAVVEKVSLSAVK